ncbi:hypothetical protein [Campylobacter sp. RM16191]|uniref:hypothetical protein n=1 Tax=Campylobacter sp. RM16191 TaxID=1705728 RepID=UPI001474F2E6|nr:hypothetical protein [Campylobacter sp. RM16191]
MAKIAEQVKKLIIADHLTGKFSQRDLAKKYNVSIGTISNLTKGAEPQNEHLVEAKVSLMSAEQTLPPEQMNAVLNAAEREIRNRQLIENATQLNLKRIKEHLEKNQKFEKISIGDGAQNFEPVELNASDYKAAQEAIDKASLTLGVNPRFAAATQITNTNAQQTIPQIIIKQDDD